MYVRLVLFTLGQGTRAVAEKMIAQFASALKSMKGFENATFFGDEADGQYGALIVWASKEDGEAAGEALGPQLEGALKPIIQGPLIHTLFEVM